MNLARPAMAPSLPGGISSLSEGTVSTIIFPCLDTLDGGASSPSSAFKRRSAKHRRCLCCLLRRRVRIAVSSRTDVAFDEDPGHFHLDTQDTTIPHFGSGPCHRLPRPREGLEDPASLNGALAA